MPSYFIPDPLFLFNVAEGLAAVPTEDINFIIPDISSPEFRSIIGTNGLGQITVIGNSKKLIVDWQNAVGMEFDE